MSHPNVRTCAHRYQIMGTALTLGRKRYKIDIKVSAEELKPKPAPVFPIK